MDFQEMLNLERNNKSGDPWDLKDFSKEGLYKITSNLPPQINPATMGVEEFYKNIRRTYQEVSLERFFRILIHKPKYFSLLLNLVCLHDGSSIKPVSRSRFKCLNIMGDITFGSFDSIPRSVNRYLKSFVEEALEDDENPFSKDFFTFLKTNIFKQPIEHNYHLGIKVYLIGITSHKTCITYSKGLLHT